MRRVRFCFSLTGLLIAMSSSISITAAEPSSGTQVSAKLTSETTAELGYLLYLPEGYENQDEWPLIIFLHGIGERGNDPNVVKTHGPPKLIEEGRPFPCIVVSPQCPLQRWWEPTVLNALLDDIIDRYKVDQRRVYLTGLSMGGLGTWTFAASYPARFAAIAPICGFSDSSCAEPLNNTPIWIFHGDIDDAISVKHAYKMADALTAAGNMARLTVYQGVGHDSWTQTYEDPEFLAWLLSHKRPASEDATSAAVPATNPGQQ